MTRTLDDEVSGTALRIRRVSLNYCDLVDGYYRSDGIIPEMDFDPSRNTVHNKS